MVHGSDCVVLVEVMSIVLGVGLELGLLSKKNLMESAGVRNTLGFGVVA